MVMMRKSTAWIAIVLLLLSICSVVECQAPQQDDRKSSIRGGSVVVSDPAASNDTEEKTKGFTEEKTKGFANFEPLHEIESTSTSSSHDRKPKTSFGSHSDTSTTQPKTHSQLDSIHQAHVQQQQETKKIERKPPKMRKLNRPICAAGIQLIVTCKHGTEERCRNELENANVEIVHEIPKTDFFAVCVENDDEAKAVKELTDVDDVEDDPERTLSYLPESEVRRELQGGQTIPYGVGLVKATDFWSTYNNQGSGKTVCVIDTGLRADHEDIRDGDISGSNDQDLVTPWDQDGNSHGSHVTGTIAAVDNNFGVVGVAPEASIYVARVFNNQGRFTASSLVAAMNECKNGGADIISMSLGGPVSSNAERRAVDDLTNDGILLVAAAGNSGNEDNPVEYPSSYDNVMSIAAMDSDSRIAAFSTHNTQVSVAGPGVKILSLTSSRTNSYSEFSGTSMATPHVAGVAALLMAKFPSKSAADIREALERSAIDFGACGKDRLHGHGLVDAMAAANFLETGQASPEQSNCKNTIITIKTDDWGAESSYVIVKDDDEDVIVYKGGPYPNEVRATYEDDIQLPEGCYRFIMLDSYGDGTCCSSDNGIGEYTVEYNGVQQAFSNSFQGSSATSNFGSCGGNTPTPPPDNGGGDDAAICGNGVVEDGEDCDDGNNNDRDACTNQCTNARCGDGIVQNGVEQCDDGNNNNLDSCTNTCTNARCGDGFVQAGEECDDGNLVNNDDSCKNNCMLPACGDGIQQSGEECDDGNDNNNDSCTDQCKSASCGDGFVQSGEECDDANTRNGDGCSSSCEVEGGGSITPSCPSGEAQVELVLNTDLYAFTENELYFYDEAAPDEDFIWIATTRGILSNHRYELSECVQTSKCYKFYFFDTYGDGLFDGGLTVKYNGQSVLDVKPYELGEKWEDGTATVYWRRTLGNCSD